MKKILTYILFIILSGCQQNHGDFLTGQFFSELTKAIEDKRQLKEFKSLPIDSAALSYGRFDGIFQEPLALLFQDSIFTFKFEDGCDKNNLSLYDTRNGYVIAAMYYKYLNNRSIDIEELKDKIYPLVIRKQVLEQDNGKSTALRNSCFVEELVWIRKNLKDSISLINYLDADLLLNASNPGCSINVEFSQLYNETLLTYLEKKPNEIIELLNLGNYNRQASIMILENIESPIHDGINIDQIILKVKKLKQSKMRDDIIKSLKIAKRKYKR